MEIFESINTENRDQKLERIHHEFDVTLYLHDCGFSDRAIAEYENSFDLLDDYLNDKVQPDDFDQTPLPDWGDKKIPVMTTMPEFNFETAQMEYLCFDSIEETAEYFNMDPYDVWLDLIDRNKRFTWG